MDNVEMTRSPFKSPPGNGITQQQPHHQFDSPASGSAHSGSRRRESFERSSGSGNFSDENEPPAGTSSSVSCSSSVMEELRRVNPFEKDVLAGLQQSFWSPSIMEIKQTPPQRSWAIEHLSHLFPKDIENSPTTHQNAFPVDEQTEAKAQADIAAYFNRSQIAPTPSPMKGKVDDAISCVEVTKVSRTTVTYANCAQSPIARGGGANASLANGLILKKKKVTSTIEKWTQTALRLPPNLPPHVEELLSQYTSEDGEMYGSSGEATTVTYCSQKSEASDHPDIPDNDSGKNSSSLNNSIRRRLELSFGDEEDSNSVPVLSTSPIVDPFRCNHLLSTPPNPVAVDVNTTTSELEVQLMRCEFTPNANTREMNFAATPGITPITDEPDERRFENTCSTPKGTSGSFKRLASNEGPMSPMEDCASSACTDGINKVTNCSGSGGPSNEVRSNLRRSRGSEGPSRKLSATSFNDSQFLMDDSSPPAKLYRRNSDKNSS